MRRRRLTYPVASKEKFGKLIDRRQPEGTKITNTLKDGFMLKSVTRPTNTTKRSDEGERLIGKLTIDEAKPLTAP